MEPETGTGATQVSESERLAVSAAPGREGVETLERVHDAFVSGRRPPAQPRTVIAQSWARMRRCGIGPGAADTHPDAPGSIDSARAHELIPLFRRHLGALLDSGDLLLVLADSTGGITAVEGDASITRAADRIGFAPGAAWAEDVVGTNAIGTSLVGGAPLQVHGAEHYCYAHHAFSCAAAPVIDPCTGETTAVIDLTTRVLQGTDLALPLATTLAQLARTPLVQAHQQQLRELRERTLRSISISGASVLVDRNGWVAATDLRTLPARIPLPAGLEAGPVRLGELGPAHAHPVEDGWLITRASETAMRDTRTTIRFSGSACTVIVRVDGRSWEYSFTGRRAEVIAWLAAHPEGLTARDLAGLMYGDAANTGAIRAEIHRIRRTVGGVILTRPYRLADDVDLVGADGTPITP